MQNSQPPSKIKSFFSLVTSILTVAQWLPFIGKYKPLIVAISAILAALGGIAKCDGDSKEPVPQETATPTPEPTASPSPTPSPKPTRPPLPELKAPRYVEAGESFRVELCNVGNVYDVSLYAEKWRLGYMGFGQPCMFLNVTLNGKGERKLVALGPKNLRVETDVVVE